MELPELTPLQFVVLHVLAGGSKRPAELRDALREVGIPRGLSAFARLIRRMEYGAWLVVQYDAPGRRCVLAECQIAITDLGVAVWEATRKFYADMSLPADVAPVATEIGQLAHLPARERKRIMARRDRKELQAVLMRLASALWPKDRSDGYAEA